MAQGINATKTPGRPSHEAVESEHHDATGKQTEQEKMDHVAMESAKRGENRLHSNEENTRKESIFSK